MLGATAAAVTPAAKTTATPQPDRLRAIAEPSRTAPERGLLKAANALRSDAHGTRLTRHGGKDSVVDGPFTESKEMVGGFFLVDCATRDEAIAIARECPAAAGATVEVREVGTCFEDLG